MCGIFAFLTKNTGILEALSSKDSLLHRVLDEAFVAGHKRGPESSCHLTSMDCGYSNAVRRYDKSIADGTASPRYDPRTLYWYAGFHRLAINGLTQSGMQPFVKDGVVLMCNGEVYNYSELYMDIGVNVKGSDSIGSDCQVILDYYLKYGINYTVGKLKGVFAFVIVDTRPRKGRMYVVRDRVGIRSLYWGQADARVGCRANPDYGRTYAVASEMKQLVSLSRRHEHNSVYTKSTPLLIDQFPPGHIATIDVLTGESELSRYWSPTEHVAYSGIPTVSDSREIELVESLYNAVKMRVNACEREVCCLLSGGLDSSLIASMVSRVVREEGRRVKTFSIGMRGSEDLRCARIVADFIESDHTEIITTCDDMFNAIPDVVGAIETYDTTTVRASVGNYLVCKHIKRHCDAKVVFNGDGADEVMGGYLYFQLINDYNTHEKERLRLLEEISNYDVLRSDKSIAGNGLEARTPFLDPDFIRTYFRIARQYNRDTGCKTKVEKEIIRNAVHAYGKRSVGRYRFLPDEILFRRKEAFSDGVSGNAKSWKDEIAERMASRGIDKDEKVMHFVNQSNGKMTVEQAWYKLLFAEAMLLPYGLWFNDFERRYYMRLETRWMPRYVKATDPSARCLDIYNNNDDAKQ